MTQEWKWILYFISIVILAYLAAGFLQNGRKGIFREVDDEVENFDPTTEVPEEPLKRQYIPPEGFPEMKLKDMVVKCSYNSAYDGSKMSLEALTKVLASGYRLLDFEIYADDKHAPIVSYRKDKAIPLLNYENSLTVPEVLGTIFKSGFAAPSPNPDEPLFVNLRIYTTTTDDYAIYKTVARYIDKYLGKFLYKKASSGDGGDGDAGTIAPLTKDTPIKDIQRKIILMVDAGILPPPFSKDTNLQSYEELLNKCDNASLSTAPLPEYCALDAQTNIRNGTYQLLTYSVNDILRQATKIVFVKEDKSTNTDFLKMVYPNEMFEDGESNIEDDIMQNLVRDQGIQFFLVPAYKPKNGQVKFVNTVFPKNRGVVLMDYVIHYYEGQKTV